MADVRALLRQQRAARRIDHPLAAYTDSGKLSCAACREFIKSEASWDAHLRSASHRQRMQAQANAQASAAAAAAAASSSAKNGAPGAPGYAGFVDQEKTRNGAASSSSSKRKHGAVSEEEEEEDEEMLDNGGNDDENYDDDGGDEEEAARRAKRAKQDNNNNYYTQEGSGRGGGGGENPTTPPTTAHHQQQHPSLNRRTSSGITPTFGVEMQIPSRPATPGPSSSAAVIERNGTPMSIVSSGTPKPLSRTTTMSTTNTASITNTNSSANRSPLIPEDEVMLSQPSSNQAPTPAAAASATAAPGASAVDDELWSAFEADLLQENKPNPTAQSIFDNADAVISAPVMSAEEVKAKSEEEERQKRRALADIQIEHEKEDATRALETEFEVMEELEARARKLRERREALRVRGGSVEPSSAPPMVLFGGAGAGGLRAGAKGQAAVLGKENAPAEASRMDEDDDEDDEEDDDDWDGFRFRA